MSFLVVLVENRWSWLTWLFHHAAGPSIVRPKRTSMTRTVGGLRHLKKREGSFSLIFQDPEKAALPLADVPSSTKSSIKQAPVFAGP